MQALPPRDKLQGGASNVQANPVILLEQACACARLRISLLQHCHLFSRQNLARERYLLRAARKILGSCLAGSECTRIIYSHYQSLSGNNARKHCLRRGIILRRPGSGFLYNYCDHFVVKVRERRRSTLEYKGNDRVPGIKSSLK